MKRTLLSLLYLTGLVSWAAADGLIVIREPTPVPHGHYRFAPLEVVTHHVDVAIKGQIAHTSVDQEFYNPNQQRLEGNYLFPVPRGAQLDKFSMEIDGQLVEAELLPAEKARTIYEDIVRKMKDPALLEYSDQDVFKVRIFPIEPRANKRIKLSYTQLLKADDGLVGYLYPLNTEKFSAAPIKTVSVKIELDAKHPLKSIYSPSHEVEIKRHGDSRATIGFEGKDIKPDTDFQVFWQSDEKDIGVSLLTYRERGEDGYFLLLASPGADQKASQPVIPKDVVFVLDTSGSMAGKKLEQAKKALQFCVENLNDRDRFEIIRFSTEAEPLFDKLIEATDANRRKAGDFIQDLKPIGGTAIEEALTKALEMDKNRLLRADRPSVIIFLTDGQPTIGNTREEDILAAMKKTDAAKTRVFCFGIGTDVNTHLLDKITEQTRAVSQYVLPEEDIELKVSSFYTKINEPVLADVRLSVTRRVSISKTYPHPLPDLFRGDQLILAGRYSGRGPAALVLEGTVNGRPAKQVFDVAFPETAREHDFIPRLWAARRIGYLLDEIRLHGENRELVDEITDLARRYRVVTPYTAYLIVEDEARREVPVPARSFQVFDRDARAREVAGEVLEQFNRRKVGGAAVAGARASGSLKQADQLAAPQGQVASESFAAMTAAAPAAREEVQRISEYTQQTRFVSGRTFVQNDTQWIDTQVQAHAQAKRVQVMFDSPAYYRLMADHPGVLPWLALGRQVQFVLDGVIYEITE